ncbi:hypothetical protein U0070_001920, partial [Myodes glareolus]
TTREAQARELSPFTKDTSTPPTLCRPEKVGSRCQASVSRATTRVFSRACSLAGHKHRNGLRALGTSRPSEHLPPVHPNLLSGHQASMKGESAPRPDVRTGNAGRAHKAGGNFRQPGPGQACGAAPRGAVSLRRRVRRVNCGGRREGPLFPQRWPSRRPRPLSRPWSPLSFGNARSCCVLRASGLQGTGQRWPHSEDQRAAAFLAHPEPGAAVPLHQKRKAFCRGGNCSVKRSSGRPVVMELADRRASTSS